MPAPNARGVSRIGAMVTGRVNGISGTETAPRSEHTGTDVSQGLASQMFSCEDED